MKKKLMVLGEYVGHLAIGAAMFMVLLLFGGALNLLVHWATQAFSPPCVSATIQTKELSNEYGYPIRYAAVR